MQKPSPQAVELGRDPLQAGATRGQHACPLIKACATSSRTDSSLTSSRILLAVFLEIFRRGVTLSSTLAVFPFPPSPLPTSSFFSLPSSSCPPELLSETWRKKGEQKLLCFDCAPQAVLPSHITAGVTRQITIVPCDLESPPKILGHELALGQLVWNGEHWANYSAKIPKLAWHEPAQGWGQPLPGLAMPPLEDPTLQWQGQE